MSLPKREIDTDFPASLEQILAGRCFFHIFCTNFFQLSGENEEEKCYDPF